MSVQARKLLHWEINLDKPPAGWTAKVKVRGKLKWRCSSHKKKYTFPCPLCMGHWT